MNYIANVYGQNCGSYKIESYPKYPFFAFSMSGSTDPQGMAYTDLGTFSAGTIDEIGQYTVTMVTYQDIADPDHGYFNPSRGVIPTSEQLFILTINPC